MLNKCSDFGKRKIARAHGLLSLPPGQIKAGAGHGSTHQQLPLVSSLDHRSLGDPALPRFRTRGNPQGGASAIEKTADKRE
jgi:hypothetical protein